MSHLLHAASLHDIGKAAVPEAILDKPTVLDEDEWSYIHRHTVIGERILAAAPALAPAAKLVRSSHERMDGQGYPKASRTSRYRSARASSPPATPMNAMTAERPYRTAMSIEDALSELRACAGSQFDPVVVKALAAAIVAAAQR